MMFFLFGFLAEHFAFTHMLCCFVIMHLMYKRGFGVSDNISISASFDRSPTLAID